MCLYSLRGGCVRSTDAAPRSVAFHPGRTPLSRRLYALSPALLFRLFSLPLLRHSGASVPARIVAGAAEACQGGFYRRVIFTRPVLLGSHGAAKRGGGDTGNGAWEVLLFRGCMRETWLRLTREALAAPLGRFDGGWVSVASRVVLCLFAARAPGVRGWPGSSALGRGTAETVLFV